MEHYNNDNYSNNQLTDYSFDVTNLQTTQKSQANRHTIIDLRASDHYIKQKIAKSYAPKHDIDVISAKLPNGNTLRSAGKCTIPFHNLPANAKNGHVLPGLNNSLISVGKLCDSNLTTIFTKEKVRCVTKNVKYRPNKFF